MLTANLSNSAQWQLFIQSPVFTRSMQWISENAHSAAEGIHELGEPGWFVNVHHCTTQSPENCTWENHPQTIDIQYIIDGTERIDLINVESLGEPVSFKPESDTQKFGGTDRPFTQLILQSGDFVVFMPGEAHRPKVEIQGPESVRKLVVKIPTKLL